MESDEALAGDLGRRLGAVGHTRLFKEISHVGTHLAVVINNSSALSRSVFPLATRRCTSTSRWVSPSGRRGARCADSRAVSFSSHSGQGRLASEGNRIAWATNFGQISAISGVAKAKAQFVPDAILRVLEPLGDFECGGYSNLGEQSTQILRT